MKSILISAVASNQGKTILSTALLYYFKNNVRPFKIGPDYIDPQFHEIVCNTKSINLDTFIMNEPQVKWLFNKYSNKEISIIEGVMGFYDGMDKGCSAYNVGKLLKVPTVLLLDASGSYITISAILKGLKTYKEDNTIKAIILNKVSSKMHFELIKKQIEQDFQCENEIKVLGWIKKDLPSLRDTHLGLDLKDAKKDVLENISKEVLENIDLETLKKISLYEKEAITNYPFEEIKKTNKKVTVVYDENFSFLYYDNLETLKELFDEVEVISSTKDEKVSPNSDLIFIPGGYVETKEAYERVKTSQNFKASLIEHANKNKHIYAECAGLLYLSNSVDDKEMAKILKVSFSLDSKRVRLGYYYSQSGLKGHAFHYTKSLDTSLGCDILSKKINSKGEVGAWKKKNVYGTYLHTMFRNNINILKDYFGI